MNMTSDSPDLPAILPVFPLQGALLLPGAELPLNIFEPRYLAMIEDALSGGRCVGMIQPRMPEEIRPGDHPDLFKTGCAGRITAWRESPDGRYLITLTGLCRFDIVEELPLERGYRRVTPDYAPYTGDLHAGATDGLNASAREKLLGALRAYLDRNSLSADWSAISETGTPELVNVMAMVCPFSALEKQALLEAGDAADRCAKMIALLDMGGDPASPASAPH
jgi:Lon protease-like protein